MFLALVMEFQSRNNKEFVVHAVLQLGEVMQKMMKVNLSPYASFTDLMQNGVPDFTMVKKVREKFDETQTVQFSNYFMEDLKKLTF
jgi:hypothetical protein